MISCLAKALLCAACAGPLFVPSLCAQARVDPSLPEAPLPHQRSLIIFPGYETVHDPDTPVPALRPHQKFEMAWRKTFDSSYVVGAAIDTASDEIFRMGPRYENGPNGVAQLYGYNAANLASTFFFTDGLLPVVFHQDPRYFRKARGSISSRVGWALRSQFISYNDQGRPMPNYSLTLGFAMSTALSNAYLPPQNVSFRNTMQGIAFKEGVRFGTNLVREFGAVDLFKKHVLRQRCNYGQISSRPMPHHCTPG